MEQRVTIPMTCFYDVQIPDAPPPRRGHPLLIALHGYGGTKESMQALAHRICGDRFAIASLQGPHQHTQRPRGRPGGTRNVRIAFGWGTMHNAAENQALHHEFIRRVIREIPRRHPIDRRQIFLLGFSQSVGLNYRYAFTYPNTIRGVVGVCGGIPGDWESSRKYRRSGTDVLHISGTRDTFYPLERVRTFTAALERRAASVEHQFVPTRHVFPRRCLPTIRRWLLARLQNPMSPLNSRPPAFFHKVATSWITGHPSVLRKAGLRSSPVPRLASCFCGPERKRPSGRCCPQRAANS